MPFFNNKKTLREHLVALTKDLVRIPTHSEEPLKMMILMDLIKTYFKDRKVLIKSFNSGGYPSLVITFEETKHPDVLLSGHVDVVPSSNRYTPLEENGLLYGSGALDMKGGIAVIMALMLYFSYKTAPPSLGIMITSDEEIGSVHGTRMLLGDEGYHANFVIINEGRRKYELVIREKGILSVKLESEGAFIHSAYPWLGKNALEELMVTLLKIKKQFPKPVDRWKATCTVTLLAGGQEENTIPGKASAVVNIRLTGGPTWNKEKILEKIQKQLPSGINIIHTGYAEVFQADPRNEDIQLLKKVAEEVTRSKINYSENHGSSDAKIFMNHGIPTAILGPVGKNHHSPDEVLEIDSLVTHFEVLKKFLETGALKTSTSSL